MVNLKESKEVHPFFYISCVSPFLVSSTLTVSVFSPSCSW